MRGILWSDLAKRTTLGVLAAVMAMVALDAPLAAYTGPVADVPEINGASLSAGLALLGGGMLWLRARRRLK